MAASSKTISGFLAMALSLASSIALVGCAARAKSPAPTAAAPKPTTSAAAPEPLSIPQTQVELPKPQPIDQAALATESTPPQPVETAPAPRPQTPPRKNLPRTETTAPPPVAAVPENTRAPMQEIVPTADLKRFQESAQNRKRDVAHILEGLKGRRLNSAQLKVLSSIRSFVALSDESEKRNEMRQADMLAERAQILARDLQNGK